jgi:hypothetical protein
VAKKKRDDPLSFDFGANVAPKRRGRKLNDAQARALRQHYGMKSRKRK